MAPSVSPIATYSFLSLPNLSSLRHPPRSRETASIQVHSLCTERTLLVALARCLGSYCSSNDVLLGWKKPCTSSSASNNRALTAARVSWDLEANATWEHVQQSIILIDTEDGPASIRRDLQLEFDPGQSPFLAIVSEDLAYDHSLVVSLESAQTNTLHLAYSTLFFHVSTAQLLVSQLRHVIAHILEYPSSDPRSLAFLPPELQSAPRTVADFLIRHDPSLNALEYYPDLYEDDSDAFERAVQRLTYGELHARSNRFAAYLCAQGLELEDRVALCLPRGIEFHIAMLGVFKAGGCYVPIDPELPEERKKFIVSDSCARFVLMEDNIQSHINDSEAFPAEDINNAQSEGLAYLLYTSGTTGTPKGCLLTHDGFAQAIHALSWFPTEAGLGKTPRPQGSRYLAIASVAFDVHLSETFVSMSLGMTLISAPRSQLLEDLPRWLSRLRISLVGIVPSLIEATMHAVAESTEQREDADGQNQGMELVYIASGGEKMSDNILDKWADHPSVTLANYYGPSEVTIGCSARFMTSRTRKESIGRIFENCSAYVVNENLETVIRGGVGELLVGGRLVGRGYHGRSDLTEKAFIDWQGERVYRTGDLVRLMPDDTFEIMGRIDTQIKLRGVRIESEGVSSVVRNAAMKFPGLKSHGVADVSTVLARHPHLHTDQLVSFISWDSSIPIGHRRSEKPHVLTSAPSGLMRALRDASTRELASYMRPAHIVPLDFLPLNPNGKTDEKALVVLFQGESLEMLGRAGAQNDENDGAGGNTPTSNRPLSETEARIADIVAHFTAIPREQLRPSSNLFELGLDSLKVVRLASEMRSTLGLGPVVSVGNLVQHPTIEELATLTQGGNDNRVRASRDSYVTAFSTQWRQEIEEAVGPEKVESILPTFPVQDGVLYRSADLNTLYVQHVVLKIHEGVDTEKLKSTWATLMSHHEILRSVFHFSSALVQVILKSDSCELPWQERTIKTGDADSFSSDFVEGDALEFARSINEDVSIAPPFRLVLYRGEKGTAIFLTLSIHHSIFDGISLPLLLKDAEMLYLDEGLQSPTPLAEVLDSIYDVELDDAASFWNTTFDGFDWSKVSRLLASGERANTCSIPFTKGGLCEWEAKAAQAKVSMQALMTASFGVCLGNYLYGNSDVVFGVIRSGRSFTEEKLNRAQAPLLSVLPTRVNATGDSDVLAAVQQNIGGVLVFEHTPLSQVQQWLQPGKTLFEALLSVSIDEGAETKIWDVLHSSQPQADYILAIEIVLNQKTGEIRVDCAYTDPLSKDLIDRLLPDIEATAFTLAEGHHVTSPGIPAAVLQSGENAEDDDEDGLPDGAVDHELEEKIQTLVSQFLRIEEDQVSATSSLFALGLDSIKSVGLTRALRKEGLNITALGLMRRPYIRYIAACQIQNAKGSSNVEAEENDLLKSARAEIVKYVDSNFAMLNETDKVELYPVTVLQAGMLSQTISSGGHLYVHAFPFKLSTTVEIERFKQAWQSAVQYFSTLRTSFHFLEEKGSWIQAIHSNVELKWSEVDSPAEESMASSIEKYITSIDFSSETAFALPPVHLRLYRGTGESAASANTLVLVMHHALYDGIAISRLSDVLEAFYCSEEPIPSPQFVDLMGYFEFQEHYGTKYWIKHLQDFKRLALPQNAPSSESPLPSTSSSFEIPLTSTRLGEACKLFDATVQCFGQAALAKCLAKVYNSRDILFGHVVSGRNVAQAEDVLGPMISTLPCRVLIPQGLNNLDFVRSIHGQNLSAQKWQHASIRSIQRKLGVNSLWDSIFVFQPIMDGASEKMNKLWQFDDSEDEVAKIQYPLNIELHQHVDRLVIKAACQLNILSETNLNDILRQFSDELTSIIDKPSDIALSELSFNGVYLNHNGETTNLGIGHINGSTGAESHESDPQTSAFIEILAASTNVALANIKLDTPLVSLGVDSISAIQISSKARQAGLNIHAADVLRCQRPVDMLDILKEKRGKSKPMVHQQAFEITSEAKRSILRALDISFDTIEMISPASAGMKWLIGMWQLSGRSRFQHAFAFGLPSDVDEDKLKSAWSSLVKEHPILRSTFASTSASDVHIVTFKELPKERLWSTRVISNDRPSDQAISGILKDLVSSPLSTDLPPIQVVLLRCHGSKYFLVNLHHFQYDAWSFRLLINDLRHLYLGDHMVSSGNLVSLLHNCSSPSFKEGQKQYWQSYLPAPFTPSLFPSISVENDRDRLVYTDRKVLRNVPALRQRAHALSLSLNAVFLACWARVQADYSKTSSATFGLWHLGRSGVIDEIASLAVPSMNVLPIHVNTVRSDLHELSSKLQTALRQRSAIVEQSHLEDVNHWCGGDKRIMLNVFINIVATAELEEDGFGSLLSPINMPYFIPKVLEPEARSTAGRLAICDLIEEAVLIDFVAIGQNVTVSIEYAGNYLDTDKCHELITKWAGLVNETLNE
ncbi:hypothetical protein EW145_g392 [Phellinidium pouzarii]|uniref:Carrier domain-containing protein n=1 Tax=Phellinidium pouzarii TaxID=167371 RepID=A0A4S4LIG5_9AGAM|nr:hypothetical protein EW145_g392 [Phellinidium pouzarii]